jgi:hypothetical protein
LITNVYDFVPMPPTESVTLITGLNEPDTVGVPEITPVVVFNDTPVGKTPLNTDHVYAAVPPVTVKVVDV